MLNLVSNKIDYNNQPLQKALLDLLVDGPSSFAALYGSFMHQYNSLHIEVSLIFGALVEMEQKGLVAALQMAEDGSFHGPTSHDLERDLLLYRSWIQKAVLEDLSIDEVGLWYELTTKGLNDWRQSLSYKEKEIFQQWMLDDLSYERTVVIKAKNPEVAEEALYWWLSYNPDLAATTGSKSIEPTPTFKLRDGTVITNGVRLVYKY